MRKYLCSLAILVAGFTSEAAAQYQTIITPSIGGVAIVSGGWYTAGTTFANGMAYAPGTLVQDPGTITRASYYAPMVTTYPNYGNTYYGGVYPQRNYYNPGYSSFGLGLSFGNGGYGGYNRSYLNYGGYNNFGTSYGWGNRGYGGGYSGNRGYSGGYGGRRR
jgi:hypothetical protein